MLSLRISLLLMTCFVTIKATDEATEEPGLTYVKPSADGFVYFAEPFHSNEEFESNWKLSEAKKDGVDESLAKYEGKWSLTEPKDNPLAGDNGLIYSSEAKHGAISAPLTNTFKFEDKPLVIQYEVRFQKKHECGGAYIKLLADTTNLKFEEFTDKTEYTIMFGPDKCGTDGKLHFIFQHKNPITFKMEEKHAKKPSGEFSHIFDDAKTHLVGLIVRPDNTFEIQVDKVVVNSGSLLKDMDPPINPPKLVDDPEDIKPEDWDEREKIQDPNAVKPDDWDEEAPKTIEDANAVKPDGWLDDAPELVADPAAAKPEDWDDEEDGEWEAPQIPNPDCKAVGCGEWTRPTIANPNYKGKWESPLIDNPDYKGVWKAKQIDNPNYFEDDAPFQMKPIAAVGFEIWSMQSDILFDNIIIADDLYTVNQWTAQTWDVKHAKEVQNDPGALGGISGLWNSFMETTSEKPWIWIIVVIAVMLPIVMIYLLCCTGGKDADAARYKKTDEVLPDDEPTEKATEEQQSPEAKEEIKVETDTNVGATNVEDIVVAKEDIVVEKEVEEVASESCDISEEKVQGTEEVVAVKEDIVVEKEDIVVEKEVEVEEEQCKKDDESPLLMADDEPVKEAEKLENGDITTEDKSIEDLPSLESQDDTSIENESEEAVVVEESSKDDESVEEISSPPATQDDDNNSEDSPDATSESVVQPEEEIQHSPKTRSSRRKLRKDS